MKHHIYAALSQQWPYACGVATEFRVDVDNLVLGLKTAAEGFTDEALAACDYCFQSSGCAAVKGLGNEVVE